MNRSEIDNKKRQIENKKYCNQFKMNRKEIFKVRYKKKSHQKNKRKIQW